jgi:hypothetical protein
MEPAGRGRSGERDEVAGHVAFFGSDGTVHAHEVNAGGSNTAECSADTSRR